MELHVDLVGQKAANRLVKLKILNGHSSTARRGSSRSEGHTWKYELSGKEADPIYRIDPSAYACSDGVRCVEP
jgi:hypothetical protein